jgi:hypothetical protein
MRVMPVQVDRHTPTGKMLHVGDNAALAIGHDGHAQGDDGQDGNPQDSHGGFLLQYGSFGNQRTTRVARPRDPKVMKILCDEFLRCSRPLGIVQSKDNPGRV